MENRLYRLLVKLGAILVFGVLVIAGLFTESLALMSEKNSPLNVLGLCLLVASFIALVFVLVQGIKTVVAYVKTEIEAQEAKNKEEEK